MSCCPEIAAQIVRHWRAKKTVTQIQRLVGKPPHVIRQVLAKEGLK